MAKVSKENWYVKLKSFSDKWIERWYKADRISFFLIYKMRWFYAGASLALYIILYGTQHLVAYIPLKHSTNISNHYTIAWTYVALSVAVVSLLYPLSLNIRDSLTNRVIKLHDFIKNPKNGVKSNYDKDYENALDRIALFRYVMFDKELPFLVSFTAVSVIRVLLCLIGVGFYPMDDFGVQIFEPQLFLLVYLLWAVTVAISWELIKPYQIIETIELYVRNRDDFESRVKPWLINQCDDSSAKETAIDSSAE